jgi:hypothetical protein
MNKIRGTVLPEPKNISKEVRTFFKSFYSANENKPDIKDDLVSNIPSLDKHEQEKCDASVNLTELTTALHNSSSGRSPGLDGITHELYNSATNCALFLYEYHTEYARRNSAFRNAQLSNYSRPPPPQKEIL